MYFMDQFEAITRFLLEHDMHDVKCRDSPMPEAAELYPDSELLSEEESSWYRSVMGCLRFFFELVGGTFPM